MVDIGLSVKIIGINQYGFVFMQILFVVVKRRLAKVPVNIIGF